MTDLSFTELDRYRCVRRCGVPLTEDEANAGQDRHAVCSPTHTVDPTPPVAPRPSGRPESLTSSTDTATQTAGAASALPTSGTKRRQTYDAIKGAGERGVTFDELCAKLGRDYSHVGPRVRELVHDGHVRHTGKRYARSGAMQDVWTATVHMRPDPEDDEAQ